MLETPLSGLVLLYDELKHDTGSQTLTFIQLVSLLEITPASFFQKSEVLLRLKTLFTHRMPPCCPSTVSKYRMAVSGKDCQVIVWHAADNMQESYVLLCEKSFYTGLFLYLN